MCKTLHKIEDAKYFITFKQLMRLVKVFWPEAGYNEKENRVGSLSNYKFFKQQ